MKKVRLIFIIFCLSFIYVSPVVNSENSFVALLKKCGYSIVGLPHLVMGQSYSGAFFACVLMAGIQYQASSTAILCLTPNSPNQEKILASGAHWGLVAGSFLTSAALFPSLLINVDRTTEIKEELKKEKQNAKNLNTIKTGLGLLN